MPSGHFLSNFDSLEAPVDAEAIWIVSKGHYWGNQDHHYLREGLGAIPGESQAFHAAVKGSRMTEEVTFGLEGVVVVWEDNDVCSWSWRLQWQAVLRNQGHSLMS